MPLDQDAQNLYLDAESARMRAYAPYSKFTVGAALIAADGQIFTGCNIENASYGLTICAERVALNVAVAAGVRTFIRIAVAGPPGVPTVSPCGACRQVLAEFGTALEVLFLREGTLVAMSIEELFPEHFSL
jgi:cytidine deaminase